MMAQLRVPVLADFPSWFLFAFALSFGLIWGSFLNVVIHRLPRDESVARPASRCPSCGVPIRPWHNIPVVSYLLLRGKASCCGARISPRYALVELLGGLLALAVLRLIVLELPPQTSLGHALLVFALYLSLGLALIALTFIDLEYMLLPDSLTLGGAALGLLSYGLRGSSLRESLIGAAVGFAIIYLPFDLGHRLLRGYPGMGLGDAKLTLLAGAWFGVQGALFALFAGAVQATIVTLAVYLVRGRIEEPDAVVRERAELDAEIAAAEGEARAELERERELDPAMRATEAGLGKARVPFGPFLALATLEYALLAGVGLRDLLTELFQPWS
ncbi:MAG TPA: prepilin peptidase [Polyangiaceae bacterium]|nr:prepilin peptidase [Polyangiaceae bacterium]